MPSGFNLTSFAKALKQRYARDFVESMAYRDKPLLAMLSKMENFGGKEWVQPVMYEDAQSRSALFSQAQALSTSQTSRVEAFTVTRIRDYGVVTIDGELIEASKGTEDAFWRGVTSKIDSILRATSFSAATALYRRGFGAIGQVSSPGASTTLTLVDKSDVVNFAEGQVLEFSSAEGSATLRGAPDSLTIVGVNRPAGTLTMSANVNSVTGIANNDFIFVKGDRENSATPTRRKFAGLEDWCPQTAPTATLFFGVDRTKDSRLGGVRLDATSPVLNLEEALIEGAILCQREGGTPDFAFMNPTKFGDLTKLLGSKVQGSMADLKVGALGFRALEVHTPVGTIKVVPDRFCPVNRVFMLQMDTWMLGSLGMVPRILNHDGLESLRQATDDGIEVRVGYYGNLVGKAPGWNCNIRV